MTIITDLSLASPKGEELVCFTFKCGEIGFTLTVQHV